MNKTVYFLGSGFTKEAGGPVQNEIIRVILDESFTGNDPFLIAARDNFIGFLREELHIYEDHYCDVPLEDVFTPIDRCIADGLSIGRYSSRALVELREKLHVLMGAAINYCFRTRACSGNYIKEFAEYINDIARLRMNDGEDRIALITTNWDILFDHALQHAIEDSHPAKLSVVDYCCYVSSWEANDDSVKPGLLAVGYGGYNIKYLKLHGSMNWFHCPMCQRMYVRFGEHYAAARPAYCRHCKKNYGMENRESIRLHSNLLMPTYLKDLSNIQTKLVWQNAAIELSEASRIVFIGYSLPAADFEIRQLLARMVRPDARIEVVLYPHNTPENRTAEVERYKNFFGSKIQETDIILKTVPEYVTGLRK